MEGLHHDLVVHVRDTRRIRRRTLCRIALQPGTDRAGQRRRIPRYHHRDVASINVGVLMQRLDDAVADVTSDCPGRYSDVVHHSTHAADMPNGFFGDLLLIQPFHVSRQRDTAMMDDSLNRLGNRVTKFQRTRSILGNIGIRPLEPKADLDVVGHGSYTVNPFGGALGGELAGVCVDKPLSVTVPRLAATPTALASTSGSQSSCLITASRTRTSASVSVAVVMASSFTSLLQISVCRHRDRPALTAASDVPIDSR